MTSPNCATNCSACARATNSSLARPKSTKLDKRICRIEGGIELLDDVTLSALKLNRVALKDELARQLKRASGQCCGCGNGCKG